MDEDLSRIESGISSSKGENFIGWEMGKVERGMKKVECEGGRQESGSMIGRSDMSRICVAGLSDERMTVRL
jgi:hypothetical protein